MAITRYIEVCPRCGGWSPWRKVTTFSYPEKGEKRQYVECRHCGKREVILWRAPQKKKFRRRRPDNQTFTGVMC